MLGSCSCVLYKKKKAYEVSECDWSADVCSFRSPKFTLKSEGVGLQGFRSLTQGRLVSMLAARTGQMVQSQCQLSE